MSNNCTQCGNTLPYGYSGNICSSCLKKNDLVHLCTICGKHTFNKINGTLICRECAASETTRQRQIDNGENPTEIQHITKKHICSRCGTPTDRVPYNGIILCYDCSSKNISHYEASGKYICMKCGMPTDGNENGESICEACEEREEEENALEEQNIAQQLSKPKLYCKICKVNATENSDGICSSCAEKEEKKKKERKEKEQKEQTNEEKKVEKKEEKKELNKQKDDSPKGLKKEKDSAGTAGAKDNKKLKKGSEQGKKINPATSLKNKALAKNKVAQKAQAIQNKIKNTKRAISAIHKIITFLLSPAGQVILWILAVVLLLLFLLVLVGGVGGGFITQGSKDSGTEYEWNKTEFTNDFEDNEGSWFPAKYKTYNGISWGGVGPNVEGVNYVSQMPETTIDLNNVNGKKIANVKLPTEKSLKTWVKTFPYVSTDIIETDKDKKWIKGKAAWEMHLPTNKTNPFKEGAYIELEVLSKGYKSINYMSCKNPGGSNQGTIELLNDPDVVWTPGAFGTLTPQQEQWYMNMVWSYNGSNEYKGKKVLVTDTKTGNMVVCAIGDFGPGSSENAQKRYSNQVIAGLSVDTFIYLTHGKLTGESLALPNDVTSRTYTFGLLVDQSIPYGPISASAGGSEAGLALVEEARKHMGKPYVWGAEGPNTFDCSGLVMYCAKKVYGYAPPHSSKLQYSKYPKVTKENLMPGDLVFFGSPIHHVGIYSGNGKYIHAPSTGDVVKESSLSGRKDYAGASRLPTQK